MGPYVDSLTPNELMPAAAEVVIIGGGIIGTSAALSLASRGVSVVLCEKGYIAGEQTSRNLGWCRQAGRDEREMPLIVQSLALWRDLNRQTEAETGFRELGVLYIGDTELDEKRFDEWVTMARPYGTGARIVRGAELSALVPGASRMFRCGMIVPTDGCAEPQKAAPAIASAAQRKGAVIMTHCAVRGIERTAGRMSTVVTERGQIHCDSVILAGGAWSSLFCANLSIRLPQIKVLVSVNRTSPVSGGPDPCIWIGTFGFRRRLDGGYSIGSGSHEVHLCPDSIRYLREFMPMICKNIKGLRLRFNSQSTKEFFMPRRWPLDRPSPFEATRVLDPLPSKKLGSEAMRAMIDLLPGFRDAHVVQEWAGYIDATPDLIPYIGAVDSIPNLIIATGFSGHGFGIGPAAGRLAAEIAMGNKASIDLTPFRINRFADGSPIVVGK